MNISFPHALPIVQSLSSNFLQGIGLVVLLLALLGLLLFCLFVTSSLANRLRRLSIELREVSDAVKDQARALDSLHRNFENALELGAADLGKNEQIGTTASSAALIREELETLRSEILSQAPYDPE